MTKKFIKKNKIIFVFGNPTQARIFLLIGNELNNWDFIYIKSNKWTGNKETKEILQGLNYYLIENSAKKKVKEILEKENPNVLVTSNDNSFIERLFISKANSMCIPTLLVQDGILSNWIDDVDFQMDILNTIKFYCYLPIRAIRFIFKRNNHFKYANSWGYKIEAGLLQLRYEKPGENFNYGAGETTKIAVFGDYTKKLLISEGVDPERVVVTGSPKFDDLFYCRSDNYKANLLNEFNIKNKKIVLLFTQYFVEKGKWTPKQRIYFITQIYRALEKLEDVQLIIKIHPKEDEKVYKTILDDAKISDVIIVKNYPINILLTACDMTLGIYSTTLLEAMILEKPVIMINLFDQAESEKVYGNSGAAVVTSDEQLYPTLKTVLFDQKVRNEMLRKNKEFIAKRIYITNYKASKKIADLIIDMKDGCDQ